MSLSKKEMGILIKEARRLKSKSINKSFRQQDLANAVSKSRSYIGDIESGRIYPNFELLKKIAAACEVSLSFFDESNILLESYSSNDTNTFDTPQSAIKFILNQPTITNFTGLNISKMTEDEVINFADDILKQLELLSYKYKK